MQRNAPERKAIGLSLAAATLTACMGVLTHHLGTQVPWQLVVFARAFIGALAALAIVRLGGTPLRFTETRSGALWLRSLIGSVGILCTFAALTTLPTPDALTLIGTAPLWVVLFTALNKRSWPPRGVFGAAGVAVVGMMIVHQPRLESGLGGVVLGLASGIAIALTVLCLQRLRHFQASVIVLHYSFFATVTTGAYLVYTTSASTIWGALGRPSVVVGLVSVGVVGTAALVLATRAYALTHAPLVAVASYAKIAIAAGLELALWGRVPTWTQLLGTTFIVVPVLWLSTRKQAERRVHRGPTGVRAVSGSWGALDVDSDNIERAIREAEDVTSCEFCVHIDPLPPEDFEARSREVFHALGLDSTQLRNGVLLYLSAADRELGIVVDNGISEVVPPRFPLDVVAAFDQQVDQPPTVAIVAALQVGATLLARYFPCQSGDENQVPNTLTFGEGA